MGNYGRKGRGRDIGGGGERKGGIGRVAISYQYATYRHRE